MRPGLKTTATAVAAIAIAGYFALGHRSWFSHEPPPAPPPPQASQSAPAVDPAASTPPEPAPAAEPPRDALDEFTSALLAEAEDTWTPIFAEESDTYIPPRLRFFDGTTRSGCGNAVDGDGTFYCAPDRRLYIDKDFHRGMVDRGAPAGSFAHAYVLAHGIGHHVQNLRGTEDWLRKQQAALNAAGRKGLQTRAELQADCFAGIWAHGARKGKNAVTPAELEQALSLPASIGVELMKRHEPGVIVPDPYSHGTLPQRKRWFQAGYKRGLVKDCDSFTSRRF
jgi:uncharacterized protein